MSNRWSEVRRHDVSQALWLASVPGVALLAYMQVRRHVAAGAVGLDSHAYWAALQDPSTWYSRGPGETDAYLYSPLFVQALTPLKFLPWPAFQLLWAVLQMAALVWLLRPLTWWKAGVVALFVTPEIILGNIYLFFAVALVAAVRGRPEALLFPLLTKVTPAAVGLWHLVHRDWRGLRRAAALGIVLVGVSVVVSPAAWSDWVHLVTGSGGSQDSTFFAARACIALSLIAYAAFSDRAWLLAPGMVLITPVFNGLAVLAVMAAIPRLLEHGRSKPGTEAAPVTRGTSVFRDT